MKKFCHLLILSAMIPMALHSAPKYPFPQNATYKYGVKATTLVSTNAIQETYEDFMKRFYEESGNLARIKFDTPSQTVSEGIGYGMLTMVYMDNATNNTQGKFDKLWNYYKKWPNGNGLMHWKINGFSGVAEQNAATDAELDVALALLQAYKQWGNESYLTDAKSLISKIYQKETNGGTLKPGDMFDYPLNPSYFSTAAMELFKKVSSDNWDGVISKCYSILKSAQNSTTGLVPDWCTASGQPDGRGPEYLYDACRTPWRIGMAYIWFGHADAKAYCSKVANWINTKTGGKASLIMDGYALNGNKCSDPQRGIYNNMAFTGAFGIAGMVDTSLQTWVNNAYSRMKTLGRPDETNPATYFNASLAVPYLLVITGNMPNFWDYQAAEKFSLAVTTNPTSGGGNVTITPTSPDNKYKSGASITLKATPATGYTFSGWGGDLSGTETSKTFTITKNTTVTATFVKPVVKCTLTVTITPAAGGTVQITPTGNVFDAGTQITLKETPNSQYKFKFWGGALSGSEETKTFTISSNTKVTATFESINAVSFFSPESNKPSLLATSGISGQVISCYVPARGHLSIDIFDVSGKKVSQPFNGYFAGGTGSFNLKNSLGNGRYIVRLNSVSGQLVESFVVAE